MTERHIAEEFAKNWKYRYDREQYGLPDAWHIIHETTDGKWVGDCEDYALTMLWLLKGKSYRAFWWSLVCGEAKVCCVGPSKWKVTHAVLRYKGHYIDNWTKEFSSKQTIIDNGFTFHAYSSLAYQTAIRMTYAWAIKRFR